MARSSRVRKLQDVALLQTLEGALAAGEPLHATLARLGVSRSTLNREVRRDEALRHRIERALLAGAPVRRTRTRRPAESIARITPIETPVPVAQPRQPDSRSANGWAQDPDIEDGPAPTEGGARATSVVADTSHVHPPTTEHIAVGTGRVVFGSPRPRPLAKVRRMALHGAQPPTVQRSKPAGQRLALHDWLPAMLLLLANAALALAASSTAVVVVAVVVVAVYVTLIRWLSRAAVGAAAAGRRSGSTADSTPRPGAAVGTVRRDLSWLPGTIGEPTGLPRQPPASRRGHRG